MIGLDTNMLMRWLALDSIVDSEGEKQTARVTGFLEDEPALIFINHLVIIEVVWLLRKKARLARTAIADFIAKLVQSPRIVVQERDVILSSLRSYAEHPGDFSDHLIGEINSRNGCRTTYTFDRAAARSPLFSELSR
jgi:predicted nucleic-acid-binding protein